MPRTGESPNMATAIPSARRGPRRRRSSTPGRSSWTRRHPPPASVLPESAAGKVSALMRRAHIPGSYAASGPEPATWKDPDPRRRSSRGSGGPEQARLPGNSGYARPGPHGQTMPGYRSSRSRTAISDTPLFGSNNSRSPNRNAYQSDRYPLSAVRRTSCSGACSCGWPADYGTGRFPSAVMASHL